MTSTKRQSKIKSIDQKIVDLTTHNTDGCLLWTGKSRGMTPYMTHRQDMINVRKHLYEEAHGEVGTKQLIPSCGNAACVHPHHTVLKTQSLDHYKSLCTVNRITGCSLRGFSLHRSNHSWRPTTGLQRELQRSSGPCRACKERSSVAVTTEGPDGINTNYSSAQVVTTFSLPGMVVYLWPTSIYALILSLPILTYAGVSTTTTVGTTDGSMRIAWVVRPILV